MGHAAEEGTGQEKRVYGSQNGELTHSLWSVTINMCSTTLSVLSVTHFKLVYMLINTTGSMI